MKLSRILSLFVLASVASPLTAQDFADLDGAWSAREDAAVTICHGGNCATTPRSATLPLQVVQDGRNISLSSLGVNPLTGQILALPRHGSVSCGEVNFSGALAPILPGIAYTTNWVRCSGVLTNGRVVVRCSGTAVGAGQGRSFVVNLASTCTWTDGPAQPSPEIFREPADQVVGLGSNAIIRVVAVGPCLQFQWRRSGTNMPGATGPSLILRGARLNDGGDYSVVIANFAGSITSRLAQISVADLTPPSPVFLTPTPGQRVTTNQIHLRGIAIDNVGTTQIELSVNDGPFELVSGANRWTAEATLVPGTNRLSVRATDAAGNQSAPVSRNVFYSVVTPMSVLLDGAGRVSPNLNGRMLEIGRGYSMTAVPSNGWISAGWTGDASTSSDTVRFLMAPGFSLTARFVTNPFPPLAGVYRGLFSESPVARPESSGLLSLTLNKSGTFSGMLRSGAALRSFAGRLNAAGHAQVTIGAATSSPWLLDLTLALDDPIHRFTGTVSRSDWTATLLAERAEFSARSNPAPFAPRLTFLVMGATDPALAESGDGYGTVTITRGGSATMAGHLADNSVLTLNAPMLREGWWPVYQPLYSGKGCLIGWMQFAGNPSGGFGGQSHWIRPAKGSATWYRSGFTNISDFIGQAYVPPSADTRVLAMEAGRARFLGGPLPSAFTNLFNLSARGIATNLSGNSMTLTIHPGTGLFSGHAHPPDGSRSVSFSGAVLQGWNGGGGYIPGNTNSGRVRIEAAH